MTIIIRWYVIFKKNYLLIIKLYRPLINNRKHFKQNTDIIKELI